MSSRPRSAVRRALTAIVPVTTLLTLSACGGGATPAAESKPEAASYIEGGLTDAAMALNLYETAWIQVDALARHFTGQSMKVDQNADLPNMLVTKENLPSADGDFPLVEDYQQQFKKLWGLS